VDDLARFALTRNPPLARTFQGIQRQAHHQRDRGRERQANSNRQRHHLDHFHLDRTPNYGSTTQTYRNQTEKANHVSMTGLYLMPATTAVYPERSRRAPTHFRVQYHRPCGA